ncbi:type II toxin-antitoxin system RelE/ParE family toxin [Prosthecobacter sp.]|uniref:type II toxin-antitoxin system RelE/ParE family toxin n=1 Tax=Prosthecobacter sp. TaxID=1965333 RepID=UPI00378425A6
MKTVTFNPVAIADLDEVTNHISQHNPDAAANVRTAILETAQYLEAHAGIGIRPRFSAPRFAGIRFIPANDYPNYLLFYREGMDDVEILRVLHGAQNLPPLFE